MTKKGEYCLKIDFEKHSEYPTRVFKAMSGMIESFQEFDKILAKTVNVKIEPIILLEDIETGSLKTWLSTTLNNIDDEALKELSWKKAVGSFLVRGKSKLLKYVENKTTIEDREELTDLSKDLNQLAAETETNHLPSYGTIPIYQILNTIIGIHNSTKDLDPKDTTTFISDEEEVQINRKLKVTNDAVEKVLTRETLSSTLELILKVKKPDYLSTAQWQFRHEGHNVDAKIIDTNWLNKFHSREVILRPGDSIKAKVKYDISYGYDNEVVAKHYEILKVDNIVSVSSEQSSFL